MPKISWNTGAYAIRNRTTGKVYVGGAYKSFEHRFGCHKKELMGNRHRNEHLQNAWNKYGPADFDFVILERCDPTDCEAVEQRWIAKLNATDRKVGYNKSPTAGSPLGTKHSKKSKQNFSAAMRKRMEDPEERYKVGNAMRGKKHSQAARDRISAYGKERWSRDSAYRSQVIGKNTGQTRSAETRANISRSMTGKKLSAGHIAKMSAANLGKKQSQETIDKRAAKLRGRKRPPEVVAKIAATNKSYWARKREQNAKNSRGTQRPLFEIEESSERASNGSVGRSLRCRS